MKKIGKKKYPKGTIVMNIVAVFLIIYSLIATFKSIKYLKQYFSNYGVNVKQNIGDCIPYIMTNVVVYLIYAGLFIAAGLIYKEVKNINANHCDIEVENNEIDEISISEVSNEQKDDLYDNIESEDNIKKLEAVDEPTK